jgi:cell division protein FtsI (penicillin-binding protein 3)
MLERRLTWLAGIVLVWGVAILLKLISLQVVHHAEYTRMAHARQEVVEEIPAPRGTIYDRSGTLLAMTVGAESVVVNPTKLNDVDIAAGILASTLHLDESDLKARMIEARARNRGFLWVKRRAADAELESLRSMNFPWIEFRPETERHYPNGPLAAHLLGGVDFEEHGNAGVEKGLEPLLHGAPGALRVLTDVKRRGLDSTVARAPRTGQSITLTVYSRLQYIAEREIAAAVQAHEAVSGSVVVMNPHTGEILALASYPTYDPNQPPRAGDNIEGRRNHAVSVPFEPGSVFKIITLTAALETTNLTPDSPIDCGRGSITLYGRTVHEAHGGYGTIPMATVLAKSSNVGAIRVGMRVGQEKMYEYVRRFGFGTKTGVPVPGESRGMVRPLKVWGPTSLPSVAMGQEVGVTTLQLAQATSVIANGGMLVKPRLVLKRDGQTVAGETPVRVIKPETAITMRQLMEGVVLHGTGSKARLDGYTSGGKTGSAQIFDVSTHHYTHTYNGSFVGMAPIANPQVVVAVTLNGTHGSGGFGGQAAAPVFRTVAMEALRVLDVPKDLPEQDVPLQVAAKPQPVEDVSIAGLSGDGRSILDDGDGVDDSASTVAVAGPKVPDFKGKTMRTVLAEAASQGISVVPDGTGVARVQYPRAGSPLREGERVRVRFTR